MSVKLFKETDQILLANRWDSEGYGYLYSVSDILDFISQFGCNAFFTKREDGWAGGVQVRPFNITDDTIYLADLEYSGFNIGVNAASIADRAINSDDNVKYKVFYDSNASNVLARDTNSTNPIVGYTKTVEGVVYYCGGGNPTSPYFPVDLSEYIGFYLPDTVDKIYINHALVPVSGASVNVEFTIPSGNYEYIKLVYKKNKIPADVTDGKSVDLLPTDTSCTVNGLSETLGTKYFFAIFTDKSVSDEFSYEVTAPLPRFSIAKKFVSDNGTFDFDIPSWMEEKILSTLENDPTETSFNFPLASYPQIEDFYDYPITNYPLQYHTNLGVYPEGGGSFPQRQSYISGDYKLEWGFDANESGNMQLDSFKREGAWVLQSGMSSGYAKASSSYKSMVCQLFILDRVEKRGFPAMISWSYGPNYSEPKTKLTVSRLSNNPNPNYVALAEAVYNALK